MLESIDYFEEDIEQVNEIRSLVQVSIYWNGRNAWSLSYPSGNKVFNGSPSSFAKFLRQIQAKDATNPRSARVYSYAEIVQRIMDGLDPVIYVWSNYLKRLDKMIYNEDIKESIFKWKDQLTGDVLELNLSLDKDMYNFAELNPKFVKWAAGRIVKRIQEEMEDYQVPIKAKD